MNGNAVDTGAGAAVTQPMLLPAAACAGGIDDEEFVRPATLREQPVWARDAVMLSHRAKAMVERVRTIVCEAMNGWDQLRRRVTIGNATLSVDAAGCYRRT